MIRGQTKPDENVCAARRYHEGMATTTLTSFADFERLDFGADRAELLRGEVVRLPPAQNPHMDACERLYKLLDAALDRLRREGFPVGAVHIERGYRFLTEPASWLQPDVSVTHPDQPSGPYYLGAPLLAFEVVSPTQSAAGLNLKVAEYPANGAAEVWLIFPKQRHAWVHDGSGTARRESRAIATPLLPGVEIPLDQIL